MLDILDGIKCRCGKLLCMKHLHDHNCTFDHHKENQIHLKKTLTKVVGAKIEKI
jgi:hypothetical protein